MSAGYLLFLSKHENSKIVSYIPDNNCYLIYKLTVRKEQVETFRLFLLGMIYDKIRMMWLSLWLLLNKIEPWTMFFEMEISCKTIILYHLEIM